MKELMEEKNAYRRIITAKKRMKPKYFIMCGEKKYGCIEYNEEEYGIVKII